MKLEPTQEQMRAITEALATPDSGDEWHSNFRRFRQADIAWHAIAPMARDLALEEAARICEYVSPGRGALDDAAARIRALKG